MVWDIFQIQSIISALPLYEGAYSFAAEIRGISESEKVLV